MASDRELFELRNGRVIMDEDLSEKMYIIKSYHPEKADETSSGFEWSEMGMANLFGMLYNREARYCTEHKSWYTYFEGAWRKDEGAILVSEKIKDFVRLMILYCGEIVDDEIRKAYTSFVNKMGDRRMRDRILKDATGELRISATEFDADPYLINCLNGTYSLRDFSFREAKWDDFLTMQTNFRHTVRRDIKCDRWEQFIDEVTQGEKDKADFLQRSLGYSILGMSNEECMFILHGKTTRNGKSTLLNIIGGIDNADSGYININGDKLEDMSEKKLTQYRRKHLGYVFQMYNLIANLNVKENIEVGAYLSDNALDIDELLHTLGLYEHRYKLPNQLSGGQQQRVSIGRAIVKNPDILLCDEPTGALDYNTSKEILKLIEDVNKKYGNTIIMVTHNEAIKNMADHVIKLRDGAVRHNDINTNKVSAEELEW